MQEYDICFIAAPEDRDAAARLADSIRQYKLPSGATLPDPKADYRRIYLRADGRSFDSATEELLQHSRCLGVCCSPDTAGDPSISACLKFFREHRPDHTMIAVILRGEPMDVFPEGFIEKKTVSVIRPDMTIVEREETIEPVASDLRADTPAQYKERLRYETVRITASILGIHPDELEQRHRRRHRRAVTAIVSVIASVCLFAAGLFLYLGAVARREGEVAERQTELSVAIARRTMEELPAAFAGNEEALAYIDEAIQKAHDELEELGLGYLLEAPSEGAGGGAAPSGENGGGDV